MRLSFRTIYSFILISGLALGAGACSGSDVKAQSKPNPDNKDQATATDGAQKTDKANPPKDEKKPTRKLITVNEVLAVVGNEPITSVDIAVAKDRYRNSKFIQGGRPIESQLLDLLISHTIVNIIAEQESIKVPPAKVNSEVKKRMSHLGLKDEKAFAAKIQSELRMPFELWKRELAHEIKKEQIIQIRIQPNQPSDNEVREWYRLNQAKVGKEVNVREIIFRPASASIKDEVAAEKALNAVRLQALREGSFAKLAYDKRNISAYRGAGGLTGWRNLAELARSDLIYVNQAFQLRQAGQISPVFKTREGNYAILQSVGQRFVPLDKVYSLVKTMLFREKQEASFFDWIEKQRDVIGVKIFMADYRRAK